jgi:hypothetical protein
MVASLLLDLQQGRSRALKEAVGKAQRHNGRRAEVLPPTLSRLIATVADAPEHDRLAWLDVLEATAVGGLAATETTRSDGLAALRETLASLAELRALVRTVEGEGGHIEDVDLLDAAIRRQEDLCRIADESQALLDEAAVAEARASHAAGEYPSAGEALDNVLAGRQLARIDPDDEKLRRYAARNPPPAAWLEEDMTGLY